MSIRFWDLHTGQQTREITGLSHYTDKLQMHSSDPNIFFSGHSYFDKILVWDLREKNTHAYAEIQTRTIALILSPYVEEQ